jgi:hypothetical protein
MSVEERTRTSVRLGILCKRKHIPERERGAFLVLDDLMECVRETHKLRRGSARFTLDGNPDHLPTPLMIVHHDDDGVRIARSDDGMSCGSEAKREPGGMARIMSRRRWNQDWTRSIFTGTVWRNRCICANYRLVVAGVGSTSGVVDDGRSVLMDDSATE